MNGTPPAPALGPCQPWIEAADVAEAARLPAEECSSDVLAQLTVYAEMASEILYGVSGRRFSGLCGPVLVRPTSAGCAHWSIASGMSPWYWTTAAYWGWGGYWRVGESGQFLGCSPVSIIPLAGYPVREIVEVKIDGVVINPDGGEIDGVKYGGYRLNRWRELVRLDIPEVDGLPEQKQWWPGCQHMALEDDQPGTFSISYRYGMDPPQVGKYAAAEVAAQFWAAFTGGACTLPAGVTRLVRQGVEIDRSLLANWADPAKPTGLIHTDAFLARYWKLRGTRVTAIFSPDVRSYPMRQAGTWS